MSYTNTSYRKPTKKYTRGTAKGIRSQRGAFGSNKSYTTETVKGKKIITHLPKFQDRGYLLNKSDPRIKNPHLRGKEK